MAMDFGALPPEITSGRMYAGPGAGPMLGAAAAWDGLAAELQSAAVSYDSVVSGLISGPWSGPSSASMATAAAQHVAWMSATAAQARDTALQARAAASAYENAFAMTVPPQVIAANRSQLASLVATNILGQNTAAIAVAEAQYGEMWVQDATAMYGYAGSSAAATQVTPFAAPPQTTKAAALAGQTAAVTQATTTSGGTAESVLSGIPQLLQGLASASTQYNADMGNLLNSLTGSSSTASMYQSLFSIGSGAKAILPANDAMISSILGMVQFQKFYHPVVPFSPELIPRSDLGAGLGLRSAASTAMVTTVSAGVAEASMVGALSVPPSWAAATPAIRLAANVFPGASVAAAPAAAIPGSLLSQMALGSLTAGALDGSAYRVINGTAARGRNPGKDSSAPVKLDRVIAQLRQRPEAVQHWQVDQDGLDDLLANLAKKPGIHTVHLSAENANPTSPRSQPG
jgi:PPE-repeat protein